MGFAGCVVILIQHGDEVTDPVAADVVLTKHGVPAADVARFLDASLLDVMKEVSIKDLFDFIRVAHQAGIN